jgi:hypothetical protein
MPKRKRVYDNSDPSQVGFQFERRKRTVEQALQLSRKELGRALKIAKGFEQQKLGRRLKIARGKEDNDGIKRLEKELDCLKVW